MNEELVQKEIEYARGKVAGHDVRDDRNNVIVARGETITDDLILKAQQEGKLHYLMLAAAASVVQAGGEEAEHRLKEFHDVTEGHEADFVRGEKAARDVRDFQDNIIVHRGDTITDDLIDEAEERGLLQELVLAVGAPGIHAGGPEKPAERPASKMGYTPYPH